MPIFKASSGKLKKLNSIPLDKEKNLQKLLEDNLFEVLDLRFLDTEYVTTFGGRIDTLAVDSDGAPVIIEYKRNKNDNVINQALSYLKWLKTQKPGFFEKLIIDKLGKEFADKLKLDWHNPRVICVAESYSKFDIDTVEVVPLRIELLKYRYYDEGIFSLEPVNIPTDYNKHFDEVRLDSAPSKKNRSDIADSHTVDALLRHGTVVIQELFSELRERILSIDETIEEKATSLYVAYRVSNNFAEIYINKTQIKIHLRPITYDDPRALVQKIPDGYNWTMDRRTYLTNKEDLDYVCGIVEQSYKNVL